MEAKFAYHAHDDAASLTAAAATLRRQFPSLADKDVARLVDAALKKVSKAKGA